jgi:hypothetical protein
LLQSLSLLSSFSFRFLAVLSAFPAGRFITCLWLVKLEHRNSSSLVRSYPSRRTGKMGAFAEVCRQDWREI